MGYRLAIIVSLIVGYLGCQGEDSDHRTSRTEKPATSATDTDVSVEQKSQGDALPTPSQQPTKASEDASIDDEKPKTEIISQPIRIPSKTTSQGGSDPVDEPAAGSASPEQVETKQVCGREGFDYLMDAYLVEHCGVCHYQNNTYGVRPFADKNDYASSYRVMVDQIPTDELVSAVSGQVFCTLCRLDDGEPLKEQLVFWAENRTSCPE